MSDSLMFDVCPETGIGSLLVTRDSETVKIDMMPDEASEFQTLVRAHDMDGAMALLSEVDSRAESALEGVTVEELAREIG